MCIVLQSSLCMQDVDADCTLEQCSMVPTEVTSAAGMSGSCMCVCV